MWAFQYKHGDRPLEGYTIQRAAGRGGFGEVYYAVSDSGREVALKVVQGYEQIELRGITQCMNLKSQHLVAIFDVKFNEHGRPFVIMEYVSGPNLRQMLDEHPAGLGTQKAAFFLREIAKGLQYLHDCGIVHRDLKPGNIFFENGIVKIGDYGLSKAISVSQHEGQTVTVGTVHYMAPEIGAGKYDRSIDIYALGALLYELLTGTPPFIGASPSEVLMKHLQAEVDLTSIEEPFRTAIAKAMAKDPVNRFQSVQEMVEAVFGSAHIQMSVSQFSPQDLSMVAGRVAEKILVGGGGGRSSGTFSPSTGAIPPISAKRRRELFESSSTEEDTDSVDEDSDPIALQGWADAADDKLPISARIMLAGLCGAAISLAVGLFFPRRGGEAMVLASLITFLSSASAAAALLFLGKSLARSVKEEGVWVQRLATSGPAAIAVNLLSLPIWFASSSMKGMAQGTMIILAAAMLFSDPRAWLSPVRRYRVTIGQAMGVCIIAFVVSIASGKIIGDSSTMIAVGTIAATVLMVQLVAPWNPEARRLLTEERYAIGGLGIRTETVPGSPARGARENRIAEFATPQAMPTPSATAAPVPPSPVFATSAALPLVPRFAPSLWLAVFVACLALGVALCVASANQPMTGVSVRSFNGKIYQTVRESDGAIAMMIFGINGLIAAAFALLRSFTKRYCGLWPYLFRPIVRMVCLQAIVTCGIILGHYEPQWDATAFLAAAIVASALTFVLVTLVPSKLWKVAPATAAVVKPTAKTAEPGVSPRRRMWAIGLALLCLLGPAGLHRLYVGKVGTALMYLVTWGWFGIGTLCDICEIASGKFRDAQGRRLLRWEDEPLDRKDLVSAAADEPVAYPSAGAALEAGDFPTRKMKGDWVQDVVHSVVSVFDAGASATRNAKARAADVVRVTGGGILSALAGLFLFCAMLSGLALALDVPGMIDAGRPSPNIKLALLDGIDHLERQGEQRFGPIVYRAERGPDGRFQRTIVTASPPERGPAGMRPLGNMIGGLRTQMQDFDIAQKLVTGSKAAVRGPMSISSLPRAVLEAQMIEADRTVREAQRAAEALKRTIEDIKRGGDGLANETSPQPEQLAAEALAAPPVEAPNTPATGDGSLLPPNTPPMGDPSLLPPNGSIDLARQMQRNFDPTLWVDDLARSARGAAEGAEFNLEDYSVAGPLRLGGTIACGVFTVLGLSLLLLSRRRFGAAHLLRAVGGVTCLMLAMVALWTAVGERDVWRRTIGESVEEVANEIGRGLTNGPGAVFAGILFVAAMLTLSWPARRERRALAVSVAAPQAESGRSTPGSNE